MKAAIRITTASAIRTHVINDLKRASMKGAILTSHAITPRTINWMMIDFI